MDQIIFSSWQDEVVDNRTVAEQDRRPSGNVKLTAEFRPGERIKAFMGWDGIVLGDEAVDLIDMCARYAEAVQSESCGKCFPCRVGSRLVSDWLKKIASGEGREEDVTHIGDLAVRIREGSKCSIGQTGMKPILDALQYFPELFSDAVAKGRKSTEGRYRYSVTAALRQRLPEQSRYPPLCGGDRRTAIRRIAGHDPGEHLHGRDPRQGLHPSLRIELPEGEPR